MSVGTIRRPGVVASRQGLDLTVAVWTKGPYRPADGPILVSVTDFEVKRVRDLVRVWVQGLRLRRAWPSMTGAVGMWLWTKPLRRRSGSVSVWRSGEDLQGFVRWPRHVEIMRRYRAVGELTSAGWQAERFDAEEIWAQAERALRGRDPDSPTGQRHEPAS